MNQQIDDDRIRDVIVVGAGRPGWRPPSTRLGRLDVLVLETARPAAKPDRARNRKLFGFPPHFRPGPAGRARFRRRNSRRNQDCYPRQADCDEFVQSNCHGMR